MRYFLEITYKGTDFHGWQIQQNAHSIQQEVENALFKIFNQKIGITASGRTDTGVHALQQYAHFDIDIDFELNKVNYQLNCILPKSVAILDIKKVIPQANARFDAVSRAYIYIMYYDKSPFLNGFAYELKCGKLDIDAINLACGLLIGKQDFQCFSKVKTDVQHYFCDIKEAKWVVNDKEHRFEIKANRFLRGMVRAIVGTLLKIGKGEMSIKDFQEMLVSKNRCNAGFSVPPEGLYLKEIIYPKEIFIK